MFKVEFRTDCKICGGELPKGFRTYCSKPCRQKATNSRHYKYQKKWASKERGKFADNKIKCRLCNNWYIQVASHVRQKHKLNSREYKEEFLLPVSRGVIPRWYKELKGGLAIDNGTYKNLEAGKLQRYKKDDPKAKAVTGLKGKYGNKGFVEY
jgi:hypothetical protein